MCTICCTRLRASADDVDEGHRLLDEKARGAGWRRLPIREVDICAECGPIVAAAFGLGAS